MRDRAEIIWDIVGLLALMSICLFAGAFIGYSGSQEKFCEQNLGGTYSAGSCYESDSKIDF